MLSFAAALTLGCAAMPELREIHGPERAAAMEQCDACFPGRAWRFIHSIEAVLPGGSKGNLIGVTVVRPEKKSVHCVLMSIEGFVVFEAVRGSGLKVIKALPPLDNPHFSAGIMEDVSLTYLRPPAESGKAGIGGGGARCRYAVSSGTVDVAVGADGWRIFRYDAAGALQREVSASGTGGGGVPKELRIRAPGILGYSLVLGLIESEPALP